jgi:hypothetical protein
MKTSDFEEQGLAEILATIQQNVKTKIQVMNN